MAATSSSSDIATEGPVLALINKRLRALRKKLNRISQMEESRSQGKTLNKEQEETLRSKPSVVAGIDELEKLRQPLVQAVNQEIEIALKEKIEKPQADETGGEKEEEQAEGAGDRKENDAVADLLRLIYFGTVFDMKTLLRARENMLTRAHERNCCLTYDYVTDDDAAGDPLEEWDLDLIAMLGKMLISRPVSSSLSHKKALEKCVEHAKLWIANSDNPIEPETKLTYAGLREKLDKIIASDYFTTTPEIKAPVEVAAAAENYASYQLSAQSPGSTSAPSQSFDIDYEQEEEAPLASHGKENHNDKADNVEELNIDGSEVETISEVKTEKETQTESGIPDEEGDQNSSDIGSKEQRNASRVSHQNYRGGRGGSGRGGRRGYANGRGGRGTNYRGGYQNGSGQFYDQPGGHYQRHYNYRGRGGRGMGGNYNHHGQAAHVEAAS